MPSRRHIVLVLAAACAALAFSCDRSPRTAAAPGSPPRLAVLSPALAQTLRDLGDGDFIVARHSWDSFTPNVPAVGSETGINYEDLLKVNPTCVLLQSSAKGMPPQLEDLARQHGWKIETVPLLTLADIRASIQRLDTLVHPGQSATATPPALTRFDAAIRSVPGFAERVGKVLVLAGTDPPGVMGPGSFHYQLLETLGASCLPRDGAPYISLSLEDVLKLDPDSIVLLMPGASPGTRAEAALGPLAKINLRCVRAHRVAVVTDSKCQLPASTLSITASEIARQVALWPGLESGVNSSKPEPATK